MSQIIRQLEGKRWFELREKREGGEEEEDAINPGVTEREIGTCCLWDRVKFVLGVIL